MKKSYHWLLPVNIEGDVRGDLHGLLRRSADVEGDRAITGKIGDVEALDEH
jgi:hypothetical protein